MKPKVWIVMVGSTEVGYSDCVDHVFHLEDDADARKRELNGRYENAECTLYAYVVERNVF